MNENRLSTFSAVAFVALLEGTLLFAPRQAAAQAPAVPLTAEELMEVMRTANDEELERLKAERDLQQEELELLKKEREAVLAGAGSEDFDSSGFLRPEILRHVYRGRLENLGREEFPGEYLYKFAEIINEVCPGSETGQALLQVGLGLFAQGFDARSRDELLEQGMNALVDAMNDPGRMVVQAIEKEAAIKAGTEDAIRFLKQFGCDYPLSKRMFANLNSALTGQRAVHIAPRFYDNDPLKQYVIAPPTVEVGHVFTSVRYGKVPEGFVPDMPTPGEYKAPYTIYMDKTDVGSLTRISVGKLGPTHVGPHGIRLVEEFAEDVHTIRTAEPSGGMVLGCYYVSNSAGATQSVSYWYKVTPSPAEPDALRSKAPDHPLLNIRDARSVCPARFPAG